MRRFFVEIAYDGSNYAGWQVQPKVPTVQDEIEKNLSLLFSHKKIDIVGCGRTDAGVHANQFYFHVDLEEKFTTSQLAYKLNNMLPKDIAVFNVHIVEDDAHARFDATKRTYRYFIHQQKDPFRNNISWYYPKDLDFKRMNEAARKLIGKKDFTSFSKLHTDVKTNICDLTHAQWYQLEDGIAYFEISANRFLRNMVRAVVGTLIEVGLKNISSTEIQNILAAKDRGKAGVSVPAKGLFLHRVEYDHLRSE
tara:strand:- start:52482 stop:53234 length:753 start_codon:yes stop_codon:yes gene_type:complete